MSTTITMDRSVIVLNASFEPLHRISVQHAVGMLNKAYQGPILHASRSTRGESLPQIHCRVR